MLKHTKNIFWNVGKVNNTRPPETRTIKRLYKFFWQSWELLSWILLILIHRSQYTLLALLICGSTVSKKSRSPFQLSFSNQSFHQPLTGYHYHAGYRQRIKLICRLTKDLDQPLILISTIQSQENGVFPLMNTDYEKHLFNKKNWGEENKPKTVFYFNFHCKKRNFFIKKNHSFEKTC